jgi:hypothetical protein
LNHAQQMVLQYGADPRWDAFHTEEEHRDAWIRNRDRLLAGYRHGRRPAAWWHFEAPIKYPGYEREQSTLYAARLLSEAERDELVTWWKEQYERAWSAHFFHCEGPGRIFEGPAGRRKHFKWADIPKGLLVEWTKERRRRSRTIRELEEAAEHPAPTA